MWLKDIAHTQSYMQFMNLIWRDVFGLCAGVPTSDVDESVPWDDAIFAVKVEVEQSTLPVTVVKLIADVPAEGTKLLPFLRHMRKKAMEWEYVEGKAHKTAKQIHAQKKCKMFIYVCEVCRDIVSPVWLHGKSRFQKSSSSTGAPKRGLRRKKWRSRWRHVSCWLSAL